MDYQKQYDNLIKSRFILKDQRYQEKKEGIYYEGHHILPKAKGGGGTSSRGLKHHNIVLLTAREHFLAHWLLWRIHRDRSSALSFHKMLSTNKNQNRIISSRGYEEARLAFSETNKGNQYGKGKTRFVTEEEKQHHSNLMKGRYIGDKNPFYGKFHTLETKEKISISRKNMKNEQISTYKGIRVVIKDGIIIGEFKNSKEVAEFIGCSIPNVRHVLSGSQKTAKGYIIMYKNKINGCI
jgi:hypothetical protein